MGSPLRRAGFLLGPLAYAALALALGALCADLPPAELAGKLGAALLGTLLALGALAWAGLAPPARDRAALAGLAALGLALPAARLASPGALLLPAAHAGLLLLAAAGLGEAFADEIHRRLAHPSAVVTAALCLALFDVWSVLFGPAGNAASGGLLKLLLIEVPAPGGWMPFVGISDLVVVAMLIGLGKRRGWGGTRGLLAGAAGMTLALGQAVLTRHAAPALPWIGAAFCAVAWPQVRPDAQGWRRTGTWAGGTAALLVLATLALKLAGKA
jgi:hypothetical protein